LNQRNEVAVAILAEDLKTFCTVCVPYAHMGDILYPNYLVFTGFVKTTYNYYPRPEWQLSRVVDILKSWLHLCPLWTLYTLGDDAPSVRLSATTSGMNISCKLDSYSCETAPDDIFLTYIEHTHSLSPTLPHPHSAWLSRRALSRLDIGWQGIIRPGRWSNNPVRK
jgi:hypothetical protein